MYYFETVIGSQSEKPKEIDTSSEYGVYIRKDIEEYHHTDDQDIEFNGWKYKECFVPNNEYLVDKIIELSKENEELKKQNEALKTQVEELQGKVEEDNLTIMLGMTDSYEILTELQGA